MPPELAMELADRLIRGLHVAVAAMADAYADVEVELAIAHADRRRSVLEALLPAAHVSTRTTASRRRAPLGTVRPFAPDASYRLTLIQPIGSLWDDELTDAVGQLERSTAAPVPASSATTGHPAARRPRVARSASSSLRGADWVGVCDNASERAWTACLGADWVAVDIAIIEGFEALGTAPAQAEYAVAIAKVHTGQTWVDRRALDHRPRDDIPALRPGASC